MRKSSLQISSSLLPAFFKVMLSIISIPEAIEASFLLGVIVVQPKYFLKLFPFGSHKTKIDSFLHSFIIS